jgi:hypothetical protein
MFLTPEELMAGGDMSYEMTIPAEVLDPSSDPISNGSEEKKIKLRPLTVKDVHLIAKAAKDDQVLTSILMIQKAAIEPPLKQNDIAQMHSGLIRFLIGSINRISGLTTTEDQVQEIAGSPIVRAFFILAKEFNWTPEQVKEMTVGQVLSYLELLNQSKKVS